MHLHLDRARGVLVHEIGEEAQFLIGKRSKTSSGTYKLSQRQREGLGEGLQLCIGVGLGHHLVLAVGLKEAGGDIEPVGLCQKGVGHATVKIIDHHGVNKPNREFFNDVLIPLFHQFNGVKDVDNRVEPYAQLGVAAGVVVAGGEAVTGVPFFGAGARGIEYRALADTEAEGGLVEGSVHAPSHIGRLRPPGPVGKALTGDAVDVAIAKAACVGDIVEGAHIAAEDRAALAVGGIDAYP